MAPETKPKKRVVISYKNLSPELQAQLKIKYPLGFVDHMIRIDKPGGDFFYAVVFENEEISYLVKVDVKIDDKPEEEDEKDYYNDDIKGADELEDAPDEDED